MPVALSRCKSCGVRLCSTLLLHNTLRSLRDMTAPCFHIEDLQLKSFIGVTITLKDI